MRLTSWHRSRRLGRQLGTSRSRVCVAFYCVASTTICTIGWSNRHRVPSKSLPSGMRVEAEDQDCDRPRSHGGEDAQFRETP